jgi:hypothetical protein
VSRNVYDREYKKKHAKNVEQLEARDREARGERKTQAALRWKQPKK